MGDRFSQESILVRKIICELDLPSANSMEEGVRAMSLLSFTKEKDESDLCLRAIAFRDAFDEGFIRKKLASFYRTFCAKKACSECPIKKCCNTFVAQARTRASLSQKTVVDLFCGAGGMSLGFTQEGFELSLANDIEKCCIDTLLFNHPSLPSEFAYCGDIDKLLGSIKEKARFAHTDVLIGGPPCQGFSAANRQRIIDDPRNKLYKRFVEALNILKPSFFVMENVRGMMTVADQIVEDFKKIGYQVSFRLVLAEKFGVPQHRERLIFIGNRLGVDNNRVFEEIFAAGAKNGNYTLFDAIADLPTLKADRIKNSTEQSGESGDIVMKADCVTSEYVQKINHRHSSPIIFNHKARYNNPRDIEIYSRLEQGDNSVDPKIADIMPYARRNNIFKDKYFKLEYDKICKTITAHMKFDCNMYIHPVQARGLTPREAARIQSYPDDYVFLGPYTKTFMQVGNSVPPLLSNTIAKVLKRYIDEGKNL